MFISVILAISFLAVTASSASALSYGLMWNSYSGAESAGNWEAIEHSGATEFRMAVGPNPGSEPWKTYYDRVFRLAAEHHTTILPLLGTAQRYPASAKEQESFFIWAKEAVRRYGYNGEFWTENPSLPYKPVEAWEVWNEPNRAEQNPVITQKECEAIGQPFKAEANTCVQPERYGAFLVYISSAVQKASEERAGVRTQVLFGGLYISPGAESYETFLQKAYNVPGVYNSYGGLSIHPYGFDPGHTHEDKTIAEVESGVSGARSTLNTLPEGSSKSLWITELGWPLNSFGDANHPAVKSQAEQARLLTESFNWVKSVASAKNIHSVYWYNDRDIGVERWEYSCGLRDINGNYRQSWWAYQAETGAPVWPQESGFRGEDDDFSGAHAVAQSNGTIDAFFRTPSGGLGHAWTQGGSWSEQDISGTSLASSSVPHPVEQSNGQIDVFWRTSSGGLGHAWNGSNGWASETLPGSVASDPHPALQSNGTIDVLYRTPGGELGHDWYQPGNGWNSNTLPGSVASDPYAVAQSNGTVDAFFRTPSGGLGHAWTQGGSWSEQDISGTSLASSSVPHPVEQSNGQIDVFWRTSSGGLGHAWNGSNGWVSETLPGSLASEPVPTLQPNGTIDVFYQTPSNGLGHNWHQSGGEWLSNTLPGSVASDPYAVAQADGTVDVFFRTPSGGLGHAWTQGGVWNEQDISSGEPASVPHAVAQPNGTVDAFYRTPSGGLGHAWEQGGSGWQVNTLPGSLAPRAPLDTTGAASGIGTHEATVNATVDPEDSATGYYFEYGTSTSYGSKKPAAAEGIGSGGSNVAASQALTGLSEGTTYHFRVVATSPEGTTNGADETFTTKAGTSTPEQLTGMAVTDPFNGTTTPVSNFSTNWSALGWASGSPAKGEDRSTGWGPSGAYPTVNGAYYSPTVTDVGSGIADVATMATNPGSASRYFSLWLDMSSPSSTRAGYELTFTDISTGIYEVKLSKWISGTQTVLATKSSYAFANGNSLALVDKGSTVSAWTNTGSGFTELLSASDSTFEGGNAGVEGAGNITRLTNFKVGLLLTPVKNMDGALKALALNDSFATNESPLSDGGAFAALAWDNGTSGHNTGQVSGGWGPYDAYSTINGAYWQKTSFADTGAGDAVAAMLSSSPGIASRYFSLWLDMPSPASARTGYELRFTETSSGVYEAALSKWQAGVKTVLASKSSYSFPTKSLFALVDKGGTVSVWTNTASEYTQLLSASDSTFTNGYTGIEGSGNGTRLKEFRSGPLPPF